MTKITFPERGIANSQDKQLQTTKQNLTSLSGISFTIPSGIDDPILPQFPSIIQGFSKNFDLLKQNIKKTDSNYKKLNDKISSDFKSFEDITIAKREPIV